MQPSQQAALALPEPGDEAQAHGQRVAEYIRARIREAGGSISFAEFMQHALYAPGLGYYVAGTTKFGVGGDFVTAPEISPLFGRVLARQVASVLRSMDGGQVLELGAGSGALATHMLEKLLQLDALPDRYFILEVSPDLKKRQQDVVVSKVPELAGRVEWLAELPRSFHGVIVLNEVADALPVERFTRTAGELRQMRVNAGNSGFGWCEEAAPDALRRFVVEIEKDLGRQFADGYRSEACLALGNWIGGLVECLQQGLVLLFDYGASRKEYYAPDRCDGWLRCHYRHRAHADPLILPGIQDVTAGVDFSALVNAGVAAGAEIAGFVTQAHFLINGGLEVELGDFTSLPSRQQAELSRQVKLLTLPGEMGENIKCIALSRGDIAPLAAFREFDRAHML